MKYAPQLCVPVTALPKGNEWIYELKYDGYRILAVNSRLISRNGKDWTDRFKSIQAPSNMVLDGEVVSESFSDVRKSSSLAYMVFDILSLDDVDLRDKPLLKRKEILQSVIAAGSNIQCSDYKKTFTQAEFDALCKGGFEGIIAKRANSTYSGTRNGDWVKLKCRPHAITPQVTGVGKSKYPNY